MTKKNFVTLVVGVIGGLLFSVGLCMCLLPAWNAFDLGVGVTAVGGVLLLGLLAVRRKLDGKKAKINWKLTGRIAYGTVSALILGLGMCMILVWQLLLPGILVGVLGIGALLGLIPMCIGLK